MEIIQNLLYFFGFWGLVHSIIFLLKIFIFEKEQPALSSSDTVLTTFDLDDETQLPRHIKRYKTTVELKYFYFRISTTQLNYYFQKLAFRASRFWDFWFKLGVFVGAGILMIGIGFMLFAAREVFLDLFMQRTERPEIISKAISKRDILGVNPGAGTASTHIHHFTNVLIPGLTIPWSHLVYILFSLLVCGIFHEAGHAIAAAKYSVPMKSIGIFLYVLYPGAFVDIPVHKLSHRPCLEQLKIICAGVWHNAVLYLLGALLISGGVVPFVMGSTFWKPVDGWGVNIISVEKDTPLSHHLQPSNLITRLDDYPLLESSLEQWNNFLLNHDSIFDGSDWKGFCSLEANAASTLDCCDISPEFPFGKSKNESLSCFEHIDGGKQLICLPSVPTVRKDAHRCSTDTDCVASSIGHYCVVPYTPIDSTKLLRIYYRDSPWVAETKEQQDGEVFEEKMVLFFGRPEEILEIVQVSDLQPRWWFIPEWIPLICELMLSYMTSVSLGLCVLNMLPAFHMDGYYALSAILIWILKIDENREDVIMYGGGVSGDTWRKPLKARLLKWIAWCATALVVWVLLGTLIIALRGS
ncbi:12762_t:CDS:2 [Ambispora leptoticha]|uniref:Endopeptidase S2P n=1 Tax=Ambispora leptoticha TaxID=144679 RepID=A0A9N8WME5_9GLOM|nr:12762_t:CDS:2 [Ambispora leptoticha]